MSSAEQPKPCKILIMGLDNSGKTSILLSLRKDTNILSYCALKPTKGIDIKKFDTPELEMSVWDFGGQKQYRDDYLKRFEEYIEKVEKMIFIIDVQDTNRYTQAIEYLEKIMSKLKQFDVNVNFSIFLHKYDPNLEKLEKFKDIYQRVNSELIDKLKTIIPSDFNYDIFRTTIYTVFEKTSV
jgi:small GTP-binding protein